MQFKSVVNFLFFVALSSFVVCAPQHLPYIRHEKRISLPHGWTQTRRLDSDTILFMHFGLTQNNIHKLDVELLAVSDPTSENYGQHWTPKQIVDFFSPSQETTEAVRNWLHESGVSMDKQTLSANKGWIQVNATVAEVEKLLKAEYHVWTDADGVEYAGCHEYHIPAHMQDHIDLIKPTVDMNVLLSPSSDSYSSMIKRHIKGSNIHTTRGPKLTRQQLDATYDSTNLTHCDELITPACLRALYNIDYTPIETKNNTFGIVELTPNAFIQSDLNLFFNNFSKTQVNKEPQLISIDGGIAQTTNRSFTFNGESDLDLEYALVLTDPQPILLLQTGDLVEGAGFDNWLDAVDASFCTFEGGDDPAEDGIYPDPLPGGFNGPESCGIIKPPNTISVSYGQDEITISPKTAIRQCNEYAKLGLAGTSVFYSSGDNGVAGSTGLCLLPNGTSSAEGTIFNPDFPATCPYVTAVGATQVNPGNTVNDPEIACEQTIFSGGGFSNIFAVPEYQMGAVKEYLEDNHPEFPSTHFNTSGSRAFPDVSANGANYVIAIDGEFGLVAGTSAATPIVASIITLINDARIAKGKSTVGFINPAIYSSSFKDAFNDIIQGGNQGCATPGFQAAKGWDPVTGVGTPNMKKLMKLWLDLP